MSTKRALVVDDSKSARFAMRKFLEGNGYQVETAESAEEAYAFLNKNQPDVIFLDHVMPGIDGLDALRTLKQDTRTSALPVVLCSSNEDVDFAKQARARGAMDVLLKPPSSQQISQVLKQLSAPIVMPPAASSKAAEKKPASDVPVAAAPAPTSKVQPIRIPESAIEQAVLKTLREAITANPPSATAAAPSRPSPVLSSHLGGVPNLQLPTPRPDALREEMERRLQKITQDLYVQLAETRAQLAHLDGELRRDPQMRDAVNEVLNEHIGALSQHFEMRANKLRSELDELLQAQNNRIEQMNLELREAIATQAQAISERVVLSAASRISDQIAESILKALKPASSSRAA
jgi:CheY-like chemotaxis protein